MYQYRATITHINPEGDEVIANIDLGFEKKYETPLRLYGVKSKGTACKGKLAEYVLNKDVMIQTVKNKSGTGALYSCLIFLPNDISCVNEKLIADKYAIRTSEC